ncbi:MAG: NADP-dependent oxidoreductase [Acidimicrobiales bacterium]|nr:NADP-dependent oxidoreductase [Hyphomonadaceae bacterium]RZV36154.1 MAG: NADP-dependent oxidoreductase [Acidimicrobiales bacterium]
MSLTSRNVNLKSIPDGMPTLDNFEIVNVDVVPAKDGEITVRNHWMSVDPYMRGRMTGIKSYADPFVVGEVMTGGAVGEIIHSGHPDFAVGDQVVHMNGWREVFTDNVDTMKAMGLRKIDTRMIPAQAYLGIAGMPGLTAYAGLYKVGEFEPGNTVLVSGAAGAVGSVVCQLAKADGGKVIGLAGSDDKCKWLESHGVDSAINYKTTENLSKSIAKAAPNGIDVYFENVGGAALEAAINNMAMFGRIAACGMISQYNNAAPEPGPSNLVNIVAKSLKIQGFIVTNYQNYAAEYVTKLGQLMAAGKIKSEETIEDGIDNAGTAFLRLFSGDKQGKMLVKLT